jgi:DNA processing protein
VVRPVELSPNHAAFVLNGLGEVGPRTFLTIFGAVGMDFPEIFSMGGEQLLGKFAISQKAANAIVRWKECFNLEEQLRSMADFGAEFSPYFAEDYPGTLKKIANPPIGLHRAGQPLPQGKSVAIVGTRACSHYGESVAFSLARDLAERGYGIVSGLARGIDMAAHAGTLAAGGHTVAILGCGLDIVYPPDNSGLYEKIRRSGTLVSEFSFGRRADRQTFAIRNRIITGMVDAVIVVETGLTGGSMLSANYAREQRKPLLAVPGRIYENFSVGCHRLIRGGALLLSEVADVVEALEGTAAVAKQLDLPLEQHRPQRRAERPTLSEDEGKIWDSLGGGAKTVEEIAEEIGLAVLPCAQLLQGLRLRGIARRELSGAFSRST